MALVGGKIQIRTIYHLLLSLILVSTNNFKNETDLRLQLYNLHTNPGVIAFCYTIESHLVSNLVRLR